MAAPDRIARARLEQALLLLARQHGGDEATAHAAKTQFERWRTLSADHAAAADLALRAWESTQGQGLQDRVALPGPYRESKSARRRVLAMLGVLGIGLAAGTGAQWYWQQALQVLALQTGHGEQREYDLHDGSRLSLAPHTRLEVRMMRTVRQVQLMEGMMYVSVSKDPTRPFWVETPQGRVRVVGTAFSVRVSSHALQVAVARGQVTFFPHRERDQRIDLQAGQALRLDADTPATRVAVNPEQVGAWRLGWLVFDQTPLDKVAAQWNDYLSPALNLADDPRLHELRVTGSFRLRDPRAFLDSLPGILPVQVQRDAKGAWQVSLKK